MGYANNEFIVPAILLDNPGATKEDLARLLFRVNSEEREFGKRARWDLHGINRNYNRNNSAEIKCELFHRGLFSVATVLHLGESKAFTEHQGSLERVDEFGEKYGVPRLETISVYEKGEWKDPRFEVEVRLPCTKSDKASFGRFYSYQELKEGDWYYGQDMPFMGAHLALVEKYVARLEEDGMPVHVMRLRQIDINSRTTKFMSLESLLQAYPQFDLNNAINWGQDTGVLWPHFPGMGGTVYFMWERKGSGYYLNEEMVRRHMNAHPIFGYSNLIATAEAVMQGAWKLLSYRGGIHQENFFKRFPDSRPRYERAVWDAQASGFAKSRGMTNNELLRFRLTGDVAASQDAQDSPAQPLKE